MIYDFCIMYLFMYAFLPILQAHRTVTCILSAQFVSPLYVFYWTEWICVTINSVKIQQERDKSNYTNRDLLVYIEQNGPVYVGIIV